MTFSKAASEEEKALRNPSGNLALLGQLSGASQSQAFLQQHRA